jgi:hypothetical protein
MKHLKNIILAATLAVASLGLTSFSANAIIITQTIELDGDLLGIFDLGFITVEIDDSLLNVGNSYIDSFGGAISILEVNLLGKSLALGDFIVDALDVGVDSDNVFAGIEYLFFDFTDILGVFPSDWTYQVLVDTFAFDPLDNSFDIFDSVGLLDFGTARLTNATFVPEPSTVALFGLALLAMGMRRRVSK